MHKPPFGFTPLLVLTVFLLGCGAERYNRRFQTHTKVLLADQAQLDQNLASVWSEHGIYLRVPDGFEEQPTPSNDPAPLRMPNRLMLEFPGLLGVFTSEIPAVTSDGGTLDVPATIAVLSNREFLQSRGTDQDDNEQQIEQQIDPAEFDDIVKHTLAGAMPSGATPGQPLTIGGRNFQPTLRYDAFEYEMMGSQGIPYDVSLYTHSPPDSSVQVAIIVIVPSEPARDVSIEQQIPLSLRTLRIEDTSAAGATPSGDAPAGGPRF